MVVIKAIIVMVCYSAKINEVNLNYLDIAILNNINLVINYINYRNKDFYITIIISFKKVRQMDLLIIFNPPSIYSITWDMAINNIINYNYQDKVMEVLLINPFMI